MWEWINDNAQALSFFASAGTLGVWLFYAHLLYSGFRRQRQARILVTQGWGQQIDSVCLISNMSQEPIYIHSITMTIRAYDTEYTEAITDFDEAQPRDSESHPKEVTRQGPLRVGEQMNLGTFRSLLRQTAKRHKDLSADESQPLHSLAVRNFKVTVVASYGPEGGLIGAQRKFLVRGEENQLMRPVAVSTKRMTRRRARQKMQNWLEQQISTTERCTVTSRDKATRSTGR
ncbi:hypothetical protein SSPSH_001444 [Salinisphaera shabanensis E1L3A]|uniref:Uncharacterized protein n=1 Tax=Salinisphaera shabanensis E1L3A TaxID=1033802 RepID=U2FUQ7_9GAMM|nr:hypothetical protein [Salinisphaera shabanensis]ERJ19674.1 hypothetical protein SSPSH_001444 [Salinisphaera shabanensis E1L3A]